MTSEPFSTSDHLNKVKAYCETLADKQEAKALFDLAIQTGMGSDALEIVRQRVLTEGIGWNWITASLAEIIFAEVELQRMIDDQRKNMLDLQEDLMSRYQEDLLIKQQEILGKTLSSQEDILKRVNLLVQSLGPKEKIAHEFVKAILDQIIKTTHETWSDKASHHTQSLVDQFATANKELLDNLNHEMQSLETKSKTIAFLVGDRIDQVIQDRLDTFDASTSRNLTAYKAHLTSTAAQIKSLLDDAKDIQLKTQWSAILKGPVVTFFLFLLADVISLWGYHFFTKP